MQTSVIKNIKAINKNEIARITGYSPSYVYRLLTGERTNKIALERVLRAIKENSESRYSISKNSDIQTKNQIASFNAEG